MKQGNDRKVYNERLQLIKPDYLAINLHVKAEHWRMKDAFEDSFVVYAEIYKDGFEEVDTLISLQAGGDYNLYFFWVMYIQAGQSAKWFQDVKLFKVWDSFYKQREKLKEFLETVSIMKLESRNNLNGKLKELIKVKSISLRIGDGMEAKTLKIDSYPLVGSLFNCLYDLVHTEAFQSERPKVAGKVKNVKTYHYEFLQSTYPLFTYLSKTHFVGKSNNKIYTFIVEFLKTTGVNLDEIHKNGSAENSLKKAYSKRGKSSL